MNTRFFLFIIVLLAGPFSGCSSTDPVPEEEPPVEVTENCIISTREFANSTGIDAIPALVDPKLISASEVDYLDNSDLVLGLVTGDLILAIPHNILWWHEIINLNSTNPQLAVTFCPLTGSGITFDRTIVNNLDFGVSGLLWRNNNVMFERAKDSFSLWSQMGSVALCNTEGDAGKKLTSYPTVEMTWSGWKTLYPDTQVLSGETGFNRNYRIDPLGSYTDPENTDLFWPMPGPTDTRRPPKERILGIPFDDGGLSVPFGELDKLGATGVLETTLNSDPIVIFYDRAKRSAWAFRLSGDNAGIQFEVVENTIQDTATGSIWQVDGLAVDGSLAGTRLTPIAEAYVSYWFAWSAFQPEATLWSADG